MEEPIFTILSSDNRLFVIEDWLIKKSECFTVFSAQVTARNVTDPLKTNVPSLILEKLFDWCSHHRYDVPNASFRIIPHWDAHFLRINNHFVFNMIEAAFRLGIETFLDIACRGVANTLGRTPNEVRSLLRVGACPNTQEPEYMLPYIEQELVVDQDWEDDMNWEEDEEVAVPAA